MAEELSRRQATLLTCFGIAAALTMFFFLFLMRWSPEPYQHFDPTIRRSDQPIQQEANPDALRMRPPAKPVLSTQP